MAENGLDNREENLSNEGAFLLNRIKELEKQIKLNLNNILKHKKEISELFETVHGIKPSEVDGIKEQIKTLKKEIYGYEKRFSDGDVEGSLGIIKENEVQYDRIDKKIEALEKNMNNNREVHEEQITNAYNQRAILKNGLLKLISWLVDGQMAETDIKSIRKELEGEKKVETDLVGGVHSNRHPKDISANSKPGDLQRGTDDSKSSIEKSIDGIYSYLLLKLDGRLAQIERGIAKQEAIDEDTLKQIRSLKLKPMKTIGWFKHKLSKHNPKWTVVRKEVLKELLGYVPIHHKTGLIEDLEKCL